MGRRRNPTCKHGHPYTGENTAYNKDGSRRCRECSAEASRRALRRQRAAEGRELGERLGEVRFPGIGRIKVARFWAQVDRRGADECWLWLGGLDHRGYPRYASRGAHRVSHIIAKGEIPKGFDVDHLCFVPRCVNPAHLEAVTPAENQRRRAARITHCKQGHEFTAENTLHTGGQRVCRACRRNRQGRTAAA